MSGCTEAEPARGDSGPRDLTGAEQEAFRLARLVAAETTPYFMHGLFAAAPLAAPGLGTFAVDRHWRLYMDPSLLVGPGAWSPQVAGAVLVHEVGHLLRDHAHRAEGLPRPYHHLAWNLAGDAEINDDLIAAGVPLPEGVVTPQALGCEDGRLAEDYYTTLTPPPADGPPQTGQRAQEGAADGAQGPAPVEDADDGSAGCGSGAGSGAIPGELTAEDATGHTLSPAEGDLVRRRVAEDVKAHAAAKGRGSTPAGLDRWADSVLAPPTVRWDRVLRAAVRRAVANQAGRVDYTYTRPSRRTVPRVVKPAMRGPSVVVSIIVDTSGSMSPADLDAAMAEVNGVLRASGVARDQVRVVSCDAQAGHSRRVRNAGAAKLTGGGGTDMRVGIAAAEAHRPRPHVVVVLTDGDTPWPDRPGAARLVCGIVSARKPVGTPTWATTVHIPPAA